MITVDANQAVADVAYRTNEVIAIYPITPASPMGEHADAWSTRQRPNTWGVVPQVEELQSEGGAAGAVHGALQAGALATTFTASQGLLLMIPNMYKIAGELTPCVIHVAARSVATHALSIFCDHSDVYAARGTGFAFLASRSVQQAQDFALIAQAATLNSRVPFLHFFDGFRTSHEMAKIEPIDDDTIRALIRDESISAHRSRALTPDNPVLRGTAQNPDTFFQAREAINPFYDALVGIVAREMATFGELTGRNYQLVQYAGHEQAERVIVLMGSAAETAEETARHLCSSGERVGVIGINLFRPFPMKAFIEALPKSVNTIGVLDRNKEPGSSGEALYLDVLATLHEHGRQHKVVGGRYGLSSKELTPAMIAGAFAELSKDAPKNHFTLGIQDDVTHTSLEYDASFDIEPDSVTRAVFWGLGSDGTVSASKSAVEILGEDEHKHAQGYFVYDSKKAGAVTVSHLRFGPNPIRAPYLITRASFVGVHHWSFLDRYDVLDKADVGATVLINTPFAVDDVWARLPKEAQEQICDRKLQVHVIDAYGLARELGMGRRINTIMLACFFKLSGVLPPEEAMSRIREAIERRYAKRGRSVVEQNFAAIDGAMARLKVLPTPETAETTRARPPIISERAPDFVKRVTAIIIAGHGDKLPVSAFPPDGTWPTATARWEKRNIAMQIPQLDETLCIQCNKCALICPHAAIRAKVHPISALDGAPEGFKSMPFKSKEHGDMSYTLAVAPEDCTGCTLCVEICPARDKSNPRHKALDMVDQAPVRDAERERWTFFETLPNLDRGKVKLDVKHTQLFEPLFEFSGACAGCGETPYIKLLTQLYGDRLLIANATGCSSIFGGNLPTTPYAKNEDGRGPSWSNSLFEDNAEFGLGMRLALDQHGRQARLLLRSLSSDLDTALVAHIFGAQQSSEDDIAAQRQRVSQLREALAQMDKPEARQLETLADYLVDKSVWIVGGDGWAYDIGFGGLDHVLASGKNVNVLVLDTEVYSNTGGQASKATPLAAIAKFAAAGKAEPKKDLALASMAYGNVYVAKVAIGANDKQTLRALLEAQSYEGPSIVIAYSNCIAHGYDMAKALEQQKLAVNSAYWPLLRFDPRRADDGGVALQLDSKPPTIAIEDFAYNEMRFRLLLNSNPVRAQQLMANAQRQAQSRYELYKHLSQTEEP
jgi:pyruvate-ferredoxin/flavodoxin oxidoreductase